MGICIERGLIALSLVFFSNFTVVSCYAVSVGDSYGGGTVFCVSQTADTSQCVTTGAGDYGLIMANNDQASMDISSSGGVTWSSVYSNTGATSRDNGATNTAAIVAALPKDNSTNNAAWLSHNYVDPEKHNDWYLPSQNELNKMYIYARASSLIGSGCSGGKQGGVQCLVGGGGETYASYWSSSEDSFPSNAWVQNFIDDGVQGVTGKIYSCLGVRAVRAFNNLAIQQVDQK